MYHPNTSLVPGTTVGGYQGVTTSDGPFVVHMVRNPSQPACRARNRTASASRNC